jgi:hypothetical protein
MEDVCASFLSVCTQWISTLVAAVAEEECNQALHGGKDVGPTTSDYDAVLCRVVVQQRPRFGVACEREAPATPWLIERQLQALESSLDLSELVALPVKVTKDSRVLAT